MRVLMTADAVGGVWNYSLTLARAMANRGVSYTLAVMGPPPSGAQLAEADTIPSLEVRRHAFRLEWMKEPWEDVRAAGDWLLELSREYRPDIVHLNGYSHASLDFEAPKIVVAHSCVCSWWRAVHGEPAPAHWNEYRRRVQAGLSAADLVIAPSATMIRELEDEHGCLANTAVIQNAAELPEGIHGDRRFSFIFAASRFEDEAKNLALLQKVAQRVSWPVFVAGDGPDCAGLHMTGRLSHQAVLERMQRAEIFCHPALYEPFGLAPLEAALSGCALALADIPSLRELWGGAALFFDPRDPAGAAEVLNRLVDDEELRRRTAEAGRRRAAFYTPVLQSESYLGAYRSVRTFSGRETAFSGAWRT
jgi:glycogen(starch) synthase